MKFKTLTLLATLIFAAGAAQAEKPAPKSASLGEIEGSAIGYASVAEALAAVKRVFVERSGQVVIDMDVSCEAAKPKCDQLVRDFMTLNERMQKAFNTPAKP